MSPEPQHMTSPARRRNVPRAEGRFGAASRGVVSHRLQPGPRLRQFWGIIVVGMGVWAASLAVRAAEALELQALPPTETRVPRTLLKLARSIEGQKEMGVTQAQTTSIDALIRELDGDWATNHPPGEVEQHPVMARLEDRLASGLRKHLGNPGLRRLRQLELQAQGGRVLLREEVARFLDLTSEQRRKLNALVAQTDQVALQAGKTVQAGTPDAALFESWKRLRAAEDVAAPRLLTAEQSNRWRDAMGRRMDTAKFQRTQPMVPEFPAGAIWIDDKSTTMARLRGRVVLVHFYAFQCHNCQANFRTYNRWVKSLRDLGVEMVGIQTPETEAERDRERVTEAAHRCEFGFPVQLDLDNRSWKAWGNSIWPTIYVVDQRGYLRYAWVGELYWQGARGDQAIEGWVRRLLAETPSDP
ncbi:MAG: redoxin domain-containing protein [Verrucomicrobiota bacterium]